jgi:hypothetical protein
MAEMINSTGSNCFELWLSKTLTVIFPQSLSDHHHQTGGDEHGQRKIQRI